MSYNPTPAQGTALAPPPTLMPAGTDPAAWADYQQRWKAYYDEIGRRADQASADGHTWEVQKLEAQREDARKGLENATRIAQLQSETSRYGTDVGRENLLAQLEQNQQQFEANHALEMEKLGLSRADTATGYLSTPDKFAESYRFLNLSGRVFAGQPGIGAYDPSVAQPKTESDFAVLAAGGNPGRQVDASQAAAGGGAGSDARVKAIQGILKASPPSTSAGLDGNDYAVLQAAKHVMSLNLTPQQQSQINASPEYKSILGSEARSQGQNPDEWWRSQRRSLPGQGRPNAA